MKIEELIKYLNDMKLLYGNKVILTVTDGETDYAIKSVSGISCAEYFTPQDGVAEVIIKIGRK